MTQRFDVCIRGGGMVGSTLALLLAQQRLRVALCVQPPSPGTAPGPDGHGDIRAYALNAASHQLLESVRAWPETAPTPDAQPPVTPVERMEVHGDQGGALTFLASASGQPALNWMVDVPALQARLNDALRFQSHVQVLTAPATPPSAALTVICEGRRSATRAEWGLSYEVKAYPHHAVAARLTLPAPHQGVARQWFDKGEIMALLPLGGPSGQDAALVWSVPADKARHLQTLDASGFLTELAQVCQLDAQHMTLTHAPQSWPLELSQADRWVLPGVALAGDAAHAMHPLAGQGLNMGLADAAELARVLQQREYWRSLGDIKLLRRYERARKADFSAMGQLTDGLFTLFRQDHKLVQQLRNWGMTGVDRLPPLKSWLTRQAMGHTTVPH
jgi:2-polyprenyl-6-methoxyphenol hydroxylase-like FAD-dependent oxidoreductase